MLEYLKNTIDIVNDPDAISSLDELPLWSAPFGMLLLDRVKLKPAITALDIGFGMGFPLIELSQRLGSSSTVYGIDIWKTAIERARLKIKTFHINNVRLVEGDASSTEFEDSFFDLIVSNVGINNFENPRVVFDECYRVAKPGAQLLFTTNPKGHMKEFYRVYEATLSELNMTGLLRELQGHIDHRLTLETIQRMLEKSGFKVIEPTLNHFYLRYANGTAFLNHYFIKIGFLDAWKSLIPEESREKFFTRLEEKLNHIAEKEGELKLTIPCACIEASK
jgi:ubiquinone/menaquinone biosynthesis C-methylase UbiE